jgi:hypothetical protein
MKKIKEKQFLVNLARTLGQDIDPSLVKEVAEFNAIKNKAHKSIRISASKDLAEAFKEIKVEKKEPVFYPLPPTLDEVLTILKEEELVNELVQPQTIEEPTFGEEIPDTTVADEEPPEALVELFQENLARKAEPIEESLAERTAKFISEAPKDSFQQPDPLVVPDNMDAIRGKLKFLEQWIGKISMHGPGGGAGDSVAITNYTTVVTTSTYDIKRKDYYVGVNFAGPVTINMPAFSVANGRKIIIKDESGNCASNPITVNGNIDNDSGGFILQMNNGGVQMIYRNGWRII